MSKPGVSFDILMDKIIHEGEKYILLSTPLEALWEMETFDKPDCKVSSYFNWRGYQATWEVKDNELLLLAVTSKDPENPIDLKEIFPDCEGKPIKAWWYTGSLKLAAGKCVRLMPYGYGSKFETELYITVKKGNVIDKSFKHFNSKAIDPEPD
jgi:hypothetical protein